MLSFLRNVIGKRTTQNNVSDLNHLALSDFTADGASWDFDGAEVNFLSEVPSGTEAPETKQES